ncbi:MAG: heme-binding domain-containing protein, partial [Flavobacteriaceae bacterium]
MRIIKKFGWIVFVVLIVIQFFGPDKNQGDIESVSAFIEETNPPENVHLILKETCYDCHSDFTRYPWYFNITPVNYWISEHIEDGKKHFNMSNWEGNSLKRKDHKFEELIEMVEEKEMPLPSYTWTHSEAKLTT